MNDVLDTYLRHLCGDANVKKQEPLSAHTTLRLGGPAQYWVTVTDKNCLPRLISALRYLGTPYFIIGLGANVLASDQGFNGVVIKLAFNAIYHNDEFLYADAGATLSAVVHYAQQHGLSGFEWATGIPATVGGAVYMNCGAFGHAMQEIVVMVDVLDPNGQIKTLSANQLAYSYRHSVFMEQKYVIIGAYCRLKRDAKARILAQMQAISQKRQHYPQAPSAGSVFKRPRPDFYVGQVIEQLGLKGYQIGGAQVSPQHAGFIINTGQATAADVQQLIQLIQDRVYQATQVRLEPEITYLI